MSPKLHMFRAESEHEKGISKILHSSSDNRTTYKINKDKRFDSLDIQLF